MIPTRRLAAFLLAMHPGTLSASETKWQFAGESQGISFQMQIRNECQDGAKVTVKMKNSLDHAVTVSFRLNDSDWRKTFTYKLMPNSGNATINFAPEESTVCHPYIDQVYLEGDESVASHEEPAPDLEPSLPE